MTVLVFSFLAFDFLYFVDGVLINVPLKFKTNVGTVDKEVYHRGEPVAFLWDYCKGVDTTSNISINLQDGIIYFLPEVQSNRPKGCYNSFTVVAKIPDAIPSGEYKLTGIVHFRVNPIKNIDYTVESNTFTIE